MGVPFARRALCANAGVVALCPRSWIGEFVGWSKRLRAPGRERPALLGVASDGARVRRGRFAGGVVVAGLTVGEMRAPAPRACAPPYRKRLNQTYTNAASLHVLYCRAFA